MSEALRARLSAADRERDQLEQAVAADDKPRAAQIEADTVLAAYRRQLLQLQRALEEEADRDRTRTLLADLLGAVRLVRAGAELRAELNEPAARVALAGSPVEVVAGARFELATFGL